MDTSSQSNLYSQWSPDTGVLRQPDIAALDTQKTATINKPSTLSNGDGAYQRGRRAPQAGKRKRGKLFPFVLLFLLLCIIGSGIAAVVGYQTYNRQYHNDLALAQEGIKHLQTALSLMQGLSKNPLDAPTVGHAQQEFSAAYTVFARLNTDLQSLPGVGTIVPVYGSRLSAARHLAPLAVEVSQAGLLGCDMFSLIIDRFHDPLSSGHGLTQADLAVIGKDIHQLEAIFTQATAQVNALQPGDLQLDPRVGKAVADFHKYLPTLQTAISAMNQLLPALPALLGISTPANYLVEVLDSTELRPGGGFIGNYGLVTISGGRLSSAHITDTYLLDTPFLDSGHTIAYPPAYKWFDLYPGSWGFRDSNLDADFPTAARYAEQNYRLEGGKTTVQGVIAITPALIEQALAITGPISIPEYQETVTAQNLIDRIHYYELGAGKQGESGVPSSDGHSSLAKRFTELLAEHFLARIHQLPASTLPKLFQVLVNGLHTKDFQLYFNSPAAEQVLSLAHLDASIQAPTGDSLFVVDANITPNKANQFITSTLQDQVTLDGSGNAVHHTTISYAWGKNGPIYGSPLYRDYVRVYVPPGSALQQQRGWQPRGTSQAFGREVWAGFFTLSYGQTRTITLTWTERGAARHDATGWHYRYLLQRQAGATWDVNGEIKLPPCATKASVQSNLRLNGQAAAFDLSLTQDTILALDYTC
jgi:hypothetical protein